MSGVPSFDIPVRPKRTYPFSGGVEYEGSTTFVLSPADDLEGSLGALVESVLTEGPYRYGDFLSLPMPLYLVKDRDTGDVFRVSVRDSTVRLHALPTTDPEGFRAVYRRLVDRTGLSWRVECRTD